MESNSIRWIAVPLSFIVLIVLSGNGLVILATITTKSLQTPPNMYIVSLAVVDFCVGVFILPLSITYLVNNHTWKLGKITCEMWLTLDITLCTVSIYHLIAIAIDRYRTVSEGIHYLQMRTSASVFRFITIIYLVALWIAMPPVIGWNMDDVGKRDWGYNDEGKCRLTQNRGFIVHSAIGTFFFPMLLMVIIYLRIYNHIKARLHQRSQVPAVERSTDSSHRIHPINPDGNFGTDGNQTDDSSADDLLDSGDELEGTSSRNKTRCLTKKKSTLMRLKAVTLDRMTRTNSPGPNNGEPNGMEEDEESGRVRSESNLSSSSRQVIPRTHHRLMKPRPSSQVQAFILKKLKFSLTRERRAARTLGMIIAAFVACWLPFAFLYVINPFLSWKWQASETVFEVFTWLGYVNSAINPIIYSVFDKEYREAFKRILSHCHYKLSK